MRSFLLTLSLTGLLVVVPALGAQSTDVKQSPELAKIEALSKQINELAASIKSAEWEARIKKLESEVLNLKDSIIRVESLAKADETRRSFYTPHYCRQTCGSCHCWHTSADQQHRICGYGNHQWQRLHRASFANSANTWNAHR